MFGKIDKPKWSSTLDRIGRFNGTLVYLYFIINLFLCVYYAGVHNRLADGGIGVNSDYSIILVPVLGLIASFILCSLHNYSNNIQSIKDCIGIIFASICLMNLHSLITFIGFKFDILNISLVYWSFTSQIIIYLYSYLVIFSITNFIIKTTLRRDNHNG